MSVAKYFCNRRATVGLYRPKGRNLTLLWSAGAHGGVTPGGGQCGKSTLGRSHSFMDAISFKVQMSLRGGGARAPGCFNASVR